MSEWIEFGRAWIEYDGDIDDSFVGTIHDRAGLVVETSEGQLLIGDMSMDGGGCSCCQQIERTDVVLRYKRVWSPPE